MTGETFARLNSGWPVFLLAGVTLGYVTHWAVQSLRHLVWYFPVLLFGGIAFILLTGGAVSTPLLAPEQLGIGVVAVAPAIAISFAVAMIVLHFRAPGWLLFAAPALACLMASPLAGYVAQIAICELTGDCP